MSEMIVVKATYIPSAPKKRDPKPRRIWDNYVVVGEVQKSDRIKFVFAAAVRDGVKYINVREFYLKKSENEWKPGRDGITIPVLVPIESGTTLIKPYEGMVGMMEQVTKALETLPLHDEANAIYYTKKEKVDNETDK